MVVIWVVLIGLLVAAYFVMDGVTTGTGLVLRALGRDEWARRGAVTAIGPFFLAAEVWLVAVGGVLLGAFPLVDGRLLAGRHSVVVAILLAWVLRDAAVWFRSRLSGRWTARWDVVLVAASAVLAALWGLLLGTLLGGLPEYGALDLGPVPGFAVPALVWIFVSPLLFAVHGAVFLALRAPIALEQRCARLVRRLLPVTAAAMVVAIGVGVPFLAAGTLTYLLVGVVGVLALLGASTAARHGRWGPALVGTGLAVASPALATGAALVPTFLTDAAEQATLSAIGGLVLAAVVVVLAAQGWMWWTFRRRVDDRTVVFF